MYEVWCQCDDMDITLMDMTIKYPLNLQFFAKDGPGGEKTEEPTQKKLDDARKDGNVSKSKDLNMSISLVALFLILKVFSAFMGEKFVNTFQETYTRIPDYASAKAFNSSSVMGFFQDSLLNSLILVAPFFAVGFVVCFIVDLVQVKWKISTKPMQPKLDKFNPVNGFKRMFSTNSLFELAKSIVKVAVIALVVYMTINDKINDIFIMYDLDLNTAISYISDLVIDLGFRISLVFIIVGVGDFAYQKWKFHEDMKMTKQEVKDEMKNSEGDPQIKGKQRARMQEASRRRMMQSVPEADVVITNPTHYAVALKYDNTAMQAPVVTAKGSDLIAQRIKEIARENGVEIVENKALARSLYSNCEIGQEVSPELYVAVADILAMVYRKQGKS